MAAEPKPKSRWMYVSIALIVILIAQIGLFSYVMIDFQQNLSELQTKQDSLRSDFANLSTSIESQESRLDRLQSTTDISPISPPTTGLTPVQIYDLSKESVVMVTVKWESLYGLEPVSGGSGFVYDGEGHILTNHHVIEDADAIEVTFSDGTTVPAELVGSDPYSDLAVIRVDCPAELLHPLPLGSSSELQVGESVMAIGNPFGLSNSMSLGIVSQLDRELDAPRDYKIVDMIQVDAAINPGNSGGPLMNMRGEVVGVNTAIIIGSVGVGFAIPSDTVIREAPQLIQTGQYEHPWIGISSVDIDPEIAEAMGLNITKGTIVVAVIPDSPAEAAGIKAGDQTTTIGGITYTLGGDVIVGLEDVEVRKLIDVIVYIERNTSPGDTVSFKIIREGEPLNVDVTLGVRPPP